MTHLHAPEGDQHDRTVQLAPSGRESRVPAPTTPIVWPRKPRPLMSVRRRCGDGADDAGDALDWRYGTGFSFRTVITNLTGDNQSSSADPRRPSNQLFSPRTRKAFIETLYLAVLGCVAGSLVALPMALWSSRDRRAQPNRTHRRAHGVQRHPGVPRHPVGPAVRLGGRDRGAVRPLALTFFSIAVVTKLTADTLDGIDLGPIEAAPEASGAGTRQMLRTAVVPQILPAYSSYVLYAFELNLRSSAVIGLVGAGGIGQRLDLLQSELTGRRSGASS